jgi:hypothetical protein
MRPLWFISVLQRGPVLTIFLCLLLLFSVCLGGTPSLATPLLDQVSDSTINNSENGFSQIVDKAQTFTVGLTGFLTRVDIKLHNAASPPPTHDALFDLRTTAGGLPTEPNAGGNILFSASIPPSAVPNLGLFDDNVPWLSVDLGAARFPVTAGEVLAFCLRTDEPGGGFFANYYLAGSNENVYPAGTVYYRNLGTQFPQLTWAEVEPAFGGPGNDVFFRTWVDPVPLPPTVVLLGSGLLGVVSWRRFRKG